MHFKRIHQNYNLLLANFGEGRQSRVIVIKTHGPVTDDQWEDVRGTRILLCGRDVHRELRRLLSDHGRPAINKMTGNVFSSRGYSALRRHIGLGD